MERGIQFVGLFARHIRQCGAKFALIFVVFKEWNLFILWSGLAAWHGERQRYDWNVGGAIFKEACGFAVDCDLEIVRREHEVAVYRLVVGLIVAAGIYQQLDGGDVWKPGFECGNLIAVLSKLSVPRD